MKQKIVLCMVVLVTMLWVTGVQAGIKTKTPQVVRVDNSALVTGKVEFVFLPLGTTGYITKESENYKISATCYDSKKIYAKATDNTIHSGEVLSLEEGNYVVDIYSSSSDTCFRLQGKDVSVVSNAKRKIIVDLDRHPAIKLREQLAKILLPQNREELLATTTINGGLIDEFIIPDRLVKTHVRLAGLILTSKAMKDSERQDWFNLSEIMNEKQLDALFDILFRERFKLLQVTYKHTKKKSQRKAVLEKFLTKTGLIKFRKNIPDINLNHEMADYYYFLLQQYPDSQWLIEKALDYTVDNRRKVKLLALIPEDQQDESEIGSIYLSIDLYDKAEEVLERGIPKAIAHNNAAKINALFKKLFFVHLRKNDIEAMKSIMSRYNSLDVAVSGKSKQTILSLEFQGLFKKCSGNYADALKTYAQVIELKEKKGLRVGYLYQWRAGLYSLLGDYKMALNDIETALSKSNDYYNRATKAEILCLQHRYEEGLKVYAELLSDMADEDVEPESDVNLFVYTLRSYAHNLIQHGQYQLAKKRLDRALQLATKYAFNNDLLSIHQVYSELYTKTNKPDLALESITKAGTYLPEQLVDKQDYYESYFNVLKNANHEEAAIMVGKFAVNLAHQVRALNKSLDTSLTSRFRDTFTDLYRDLADLLLKKNRFPEAERILDLLKEEELRQFVRRSPDDYSSTNVVPLSPTEKEWEKNISDAHALIHKQAKRYWDLIEDSKGDLDEAELERIEEDLNKARTNFLNVLSYLKEYQLDESTNNKRAGELGAMNLNAMESMKSMLADQGAGTAVLIRTVLLEDKLLFLITTPHLQVAREVVVDRLKLSNKILSYRKMIKATDSSVNDLSKELYQTVVSPVLEDLQASGAKLVLWSLDGSLRYLPIPALYNGKSYFVQQYSSILFTAASQSGLLTTRQKKATTIAALGTGEAHGSYPALTGVPVELESIVKKNPDDDGVMNGVIYLNQDFNLGNFKKVLRRRYPIIHIASHFDLKAGNNLDSALLLGDGSELKIAEFKNNSTMNFSGVSLLVLSACNTGMNTIKNGSKAGEEVESFGAIAQLRGAASVMATLWPVADEGTSLFMQQFYKYLSEGDTKVTALRKTQLNFLQKDTVATESNNDRGLVSNKKTRRSALDPVSDFAHPYYWAPFILIGNWL